MAQEWYYMAGGEKHGPYAEIELRSMLLKEELRPDVLVCCEGMSGWKRAVDIAAFQNIQRSLPKAVLPMRREPRRPRKASSHVNTPSSSTESSLLTEPAGTNGKPVPRVPAYVPNYLMPCILSTLFCCLPFGVIGIVNACRVDPLVRSGQIEEAWSASSNAKMWCSTSFIFGLVGTVLIGIIRASIG